MEALQKSLNAYLLITRMREICLNYDNLQNWDINKVKVCLERLR